MTNKHGDFGWYELMTSDADAAQDFYGALIGWEFADAAFNDMDYRSFSADSGPIGGFLTLTEEMKAGGARPAWLGYICVDDVPAALAKIRTAGGKVLMEGKEVPSIGPFAMVTDPQGALFYIINNQSGHAFDAFAAAEPIMGHCAWNELATEDPAAAKAFYSGQFGWVQDGDMDMGPMGKYEFLKVGDERGHMIGAVMPKPPEMPVSAWTYYFRVPDIDAAMTTIKAKGGKVLHDPAEIPGGEFMLNGVDPQGAYFAIVGVRK